MKGYEVSGRFWGSSIGPRGTPFCFRSALSLLPFGSQEMQLGSEVGLIATTNTESTITSAAMQTNSPVDPPPSSAPREAGSNTLFIAVTSIFWAGADGAAGAVFRDTHFTNTHKLNRRD